MLKNKFIGSFLGLAVGDALGAPIEFEARDSYRAITEMCEGGPFNLKIGQWTDDTGLAICIAVNRGEDSDTTGAVFGQLAGAFYGVESIRPDFLEKIWNLKLLELIALNLYKDRI